MESQDALLGSGNQARQVYQMHALSCYDVNTIFCSPAYASASPRARFNIVDIGKPFRIISQASILVHTSLPSTSNALVTQRFE